MVVSATFNNISVTPWRSVLLEEESGGPGENPLTKSVLTKKDGVEIQTLDL
jgi:hypothetical protein